MPDLLSDPDAVQPPTLDPAAFDRLRHTLTDRGPAAAAAALVEEMRAANDLNGLFYAMLLQKRVELGVSPFPTGPSADLPPETHQPYEDAIRDAGRLVGRLFLDRGDFPKAWSFFRMLGEPDPVRDALAAYDPPADADIYPLIEIAWQNGVLPKKGFDLVLARHGVCSAITMAGSSDLTGNPELRDHCVGQLARALHDQLTERLRTDLETRGTPGYSPAPRGPSAAPPSEGAGGIPAGPGEPNATITQMVAKHPEVFADDAYHVDTSHLSSVVQMALYLAPGPELDLARELCEYGRHLAPHLQGGGDAPFDEMYADYLAFLNVVAGIEVEAGVERFRAKAAREAEEGNTHPAQVYVNLLLRANRTADALAAAKTFLMTEDDARLVCPGVAELAKRVGDYAALADAAKSRADAVGYLAGLIAGRK